MKLDILAIGAHPDDIELSCAGTILKEIAAGKKVGVLDLTHGELGTRGSGELRLIEAAASAKILGLSCRENVDFADGFFKNDEEHIKGIVRILRKYRPEVILSNAPTDRHPDHGRGSKLTSDACFYSGLRRIETEMNGETQEAWRPKVIYNYIQDRFLKPDFVVDVTPFVPKKMESIKAFKSQFFNPESNEPESPLTMKNFFDYVSGRMVDMGRYIGADYAEGFLVERPAGVESILDLY
ncbi:MAG: bacillithiol biosynthesis deacetylase BshB1 [Flavobacteriales bacterium]|nr:bacillithiol biosynthesis deacetylase BshB1 [Flavobacteriales bacterium]